MGNVSVRPLHRRREYALNRWEGRNPYANEEARTVPIYGDQAYLTNDARFSICYIVGAWRVNLHSYWRTTDETGAIASTGLFDAAFPRRIDAIVALEQTLEAVIE